LANDATQVYTHHLDGSSFACIGKENGCPGCGPQSSKRWRAYFPAFCPQSGRLFLVELTPNAVRSCPALLDSNTPRKGRWIILRRRGQKANSPIMAELGEGFRHFRPPEAFDVKDALIRIWRMSVIILPPPGRPPASC
jgi:hypothetical protein